ncbi:MAG: PTS glucose transporter subunit IIA [Aerococcus sp.]|nr:PTS glucose transporter subunit IIA [Aerococcus sp.]
MGLFDFFKKEEAPSQKTIAIHSPLTGQLVPLVDVPDQVFAGEMMGNGIAVQPKMKKQTVVSPISGEVVSVFPTKHAVTLQTNEGIELLLHVGLDTVELEGKGFTAHVKDGDTVKAGDDLLTVDFPSVDAAGYATVTPIVVTNASDIHGMALVASGSVDAGDTLLMVTINQ